MMRIVARYIKALTIFSPPLLHTAAMRKQSNLQMVDLLIELGVDVNAVYVKRDNENSGNTSDALPSYAATHILAMGENWWNISALNSVCQSRSRSRACRRTWLNSLEMCPRAQEQHTDSRLLV
jgi:hypothetical protein